MTPEMEDLLRRAREEGIREGMEGARAAMERFLYCRIGQSINSGTIISLRAALSAPAEEPRVVHRCAECRRWAGYETCSLNLPEPKGRCLHYWPKTPEPSPSPRAEEQGSCGECGHLMGNHCGADHKGPCGVGYCTCVAGRAVGTGKERKP